MSKIADLPAREPVDLRDEDQMRYMLEELTRVNHHWAAAELAKHFTALNARIAELELERDVERERNE